MLTLYHSMCLLIHYTFSQVKTFTSYVLSYRKLDFWQISYFAITFFSTFFLVEKSAAPYVIISQLPQCCGYIKTCFNSHTDFKIGVKYTSNLLQINFKFTSILLLISFKFASYSFQMHFVLALSLKFLCSDQSFLQFA